MLVPAAKLLFQMKLSLCYLIRKRPEGEEAAFSRALEAALVTFHAFFDKQFTKCYDLDSRHLRPPKSLVNVNLVLEVVFS